MNIIDWNKFSTSACLEYFDGDIQYKLCALLLKHDSQVIFTNSVTKLLFAKYQPLVYQPIVHLYLSRGYCQLHLSSSLKRTKLKEREKSFQSSDQIWSRLDILKLLLLILLRLLILQLCIFVNIEWIGWSNDNFVLIVRHENYEQLMFHDMNCLEN